MGRKPPHLPKSTPGPRFASASTSGTANANLDASASASAAAPALAADSSNTSHVHVNGQRHDRSNWRSRGNADAELASGRDRDRNRDRSRHADRDRNRERERHMARDRDRDRDRDGRSRYIPQRQRSHSRTRAPTSSISDTRVYGRRDYSPPRHAHHSRDDRRQPTYGDEYRSRDSGPRDFGEHQDRRDYRRERPRPMNSRSQAQYDNDRRDATRAPPSTGNARIPHYHHGYSRPPPPPSRGETNSRLSQRVENDMRINSPHMLGVPLSLPPRPLPFAVPPRPGIESLLTSSNPSSPRPFSTRRRRPSASRDYLVQSFGEPTLLPAPRPLLVILDLNGTLLHRKKKTNRATCRPYLHPFINSLIASHRSMIWTSTMPANTMTTVTSVFNKYTLNKFVDVWARDRLRLREWEYNNKVQVYKNLEWVWEDNNVQGSSDASGWDQKNTVLVDDSRVKAASHPFNLIEIPEFDGKVTSFFDEGKALLTVLRQLRVLSWYADVSTKIREWDELKETKFPLSEDEEDDLDLDDIEREAKLKSQSPEERKEDENRLIARRYDMEDFWDGVLDAEEKKLELEPLVFEGQPSPAPKPVVVEEQKGNEGKPGSRKKKREAARLAAKKEKNATKREDRKAVAKAGAGR